MPLTGLASQGCGFGQSRGWAFCLSKSRRPLGPSCSVTCRRQIHLNTDTANLSQAICALIVWWKRDLSRPMTMCAQEPREQRTRACDCWEEPAASGCWVLCSEGQSSSRAPTLLESCTQALGHFAAVSGPSRLELGRGGSWNLWGSLYNTG